MADVNIAYMIIGCALVTFIPRLIPAVFVDKLNFGPGFEKFLNLIPFTALAALICPGVLTVDPNIWYIGLLLWGKYIIREESSSWSYCYYNCDCIDNIVFSYSILWSNCCLICIYLSF